MTIGIVVALPEELGTLTRQKLAQGECVKLADNILLTLAGAGPVNAERAGRLLITKGAGKLISWGCAAALAPALRPGDLVLTEQLSSEHGPAFDTDRHWREHLQQILDKRLPLAIGKLAESSRIIANSSDKRQIHANSGAIALDMESCAIAKVARQASLPFLAIRAIADPASMDLPQTVAQALNDHGQVELGRLLRFLLTRPSEIPDLIRLGLYFHAARKTLKTVARHLNEIIKY